MRVQLGFYHITHVRRAVRLLCSGAAAPPTPMLSAQALVRGTLQLCRTRKRARAQTLLVRSARIILVAS